MGMRHADFTQLLDHLSGRGRRPVAGHIERCLACTESLERARLILEAGRRAMKAPKPSKRAIGRAMRLFRDFHRPPRPGFLRLVLDSFLQPAPAVRSTAANPPPFLRFDGQITVELQLTAGSRGVDMHGQLTPPDCAREIEVRAADRVLRRARVGSEGHFEMTNLPRREVEIRIGEARIGGLHLE